MNQVIEQIYRTTSVDDADGRTRSLGNSPIHREVGRMLYEAVRSSRSRKTLEVGMGYGLSALHICQALHDQGGGHHTAIDPFQGTDYDSLGVLNLERAGLAGHFRLIEECSHFALPKLCQDGERFDFAFIDGYHTFDFVLLDFFYADRVLETGGLIAFDDLWMPAVRRVVKYVLTNRAYELVRPPVLDPTGHWRRWSSVGRRFLTDPLGRDVALKLIPVNVCFVRKMAEDSRPWNFHRHF